MTGLIQRFRPRGVTACVLAGALALTACGGDGDGGDTATGGATPADGADATDAAASAQACADVDLSNPPAEPVAMPMGRGPSSEEPLYVLDTAPDVAGAQYAGEWYDLTVTQYAPPDRIAAFQAGELVGGTISSPALFSAVDSGLPLVAVASIGTIKEDGYKYPYVTLADSGITSPEDLEGAKIGIIAPNTATEFWAQSAVASAGLDPARDVSLVSVPPPNAGPALASGQVDVQMLVEDFDAVVREKNDVVEVFNALTGTGFPHEFLMVFLGTEFIEANLGAACAFIADYQTAMNNYIDNREAFGEVIVEEQLLRVPTVEAFMARPDVGRTRDAELDVDNLQKLLDRMVEVGFYEEPLSIDATDTVMPGVSATLDG